MIINKIVVTARGILTSNKVRIIALKEDYYYRGNYLYL